jgi:ClpP class serine protease
VAASGGYWLLCQGDQIYANKSSIVGSIGVISALAGLKGPLDAAKIQRVTITTNENLLQNKVDPFSKEKISEED